MLYTEDTRIAALAVHIVGNKAKDEPLLVAPALSGQVGDTGLMQTLTAYFAGGFKSEEYYNLHHETDLACNEVYNFVCKVFDDRETFYDNSVGLARHLYETGTHPQIKGGEFYVVYFTGCRFGGEAVDAVGLFKSETRDTFLEVGEQDGQLHISSCQGINVDKLDKGCLVFNTEREEGFAVCVVDNTNRAEARYWIDDFLHVRPRQDNYHNTHNVLAMCKKYVTGHLPSEFDVSKADQAEMLNETMKYFREQDNFSLDDFSEKVTKSFTLYAAWEEKDDSLRQIILTVGKKEALVFGKTKSNDVAPVIRNDRTMLPARFVAENLGATVTWDEEKRLVTITGNGVTILLTIGEETAMINGKEVKLGSPAFIENDRTYTPVRFIAEELGATVEWIETEQKVVITK